MSIGQLRRDVERKEIKVVVPEGWFVTVEHEDQSDGILNVLGLTERACMVRTPTAPFPVRKTAKEPA